MATSSGAERSGGGREAPDPSWTWEPGALGVLAVVALGAGVGGLALGAEGDAGPTATRTRLESYVAGLRDGTDAPDGRIDEWVAAGHRALASPVAVQLPFRTSGRFTAEEPAAVAYRFRLREGQRIEASVSGEAPTAGREVSAGRYFVELYRVPPGAEADRALVAEADPADAPLTHEARYDGGYVLRVMPEPFRESGYAVEVGSEAAFPFPVADRGPSAVISRYGAPRDGGSRSHEGVDIVAPAGTPVIAVTKSLVLDVGTSELGGNYVWLQDWTREKELYYAHLERSWVEVGMVVEPGDEIGTVGNTGNASRTDPHLHFGVYDLEREPSDPLPYIVPPEALRRASGDEEE